MNFLFLHMVTRNLRSILVLLSVARVWRVPLVLGSHLFSVCRKEYRKFGFFGAALVSTTAVECMLWAGFAGVDALRAMFPSSVLRPRCSASWPV